MEWKIGEIKQVNGEWYQCIEQPEKYDKTVCDLCDFHGIGNCELDRCSGTYRSDKKNIIFKKLKKVGEPYEYYVSKKGIIQVQDYLLADPNHTVYNKIEGVYDYLDGKVVIEIKQNKEEGIEEKKVKLSQEEYDYIRKKIKVVILPGNLADDVDSDELGSEIMKLFSIDEKLTKIETNGTCFNNYKKEDCHTREFYVEVKQNKEEHMEEKKTNFIEKLGALCKRFNMSDGVRTDFISEVKEIIKDKEECKFKPFDLEEAKAGKPVCTRDGRKARIICFDRIDSTGCNLSIVALIQCEGTEVLQLYRNDGKRGRRADLDLMMLPEKKEGWINVYKSQIHNTLKSAEEGHKGITDYIETIKVEWEE